MSTIYSGLAQGGPKHGKPVSSYSRRIDHDTGFYVYTLPVGTTPSGWKWVENKGTGK